MTLTSRCGKVAHVDALMFASASVIAHAVRTRQVSARELLEASLAHVSRVNPLLNAVVALDPEHVAARALIVEIHASSGRLAEAAEALAALAASRETPRAQRKVARLGAVDLFDKRLGQPEAAIAQLDALVQEGDADDEILARGLEIARTAERWESARRFAIRQADRIGAAAAKAQALGKPVEEVTQAYTAQAALNRMVAAGDIANMALFAASDLAANVTGQELVVDGLTQALS